MIMAGLVFVDGQREDKAGTKIDTTATILVKKDPNPYVSRGGLKLQKAIQTFDLLLEGAIAMDVGASTGGFTDCMLQHGAAKVYAVDVGYGQFDWGLRQDPRVVCLEKTNIRYVTEAEIPDLLDFVSIDVSFISLSKVLPAVCALMKEGATIVCLIKPQFEAGRDKVGKKVWFAIPRFIKKLLRTSFIHLERLIYLLRESVILLLQVLKGILNT